MGDHDHGAPFALQFGQGGDQGIFTLLIQVGIGLVQDHQLRVAEQGAGQSQPLLLSGGEDIAVAEDFGVVAFRQPQDHVVDTGGAGGRHYPVGVDGAESRDVFADAAVEKFDVLRQIADVVAQRLPVPLGGFGAIKPDGPLAYGIKPQDRAEQGGFAGGAGSDHTQCGARFDPKADALEHRGGRARRLDDGAFQEDFTPRGGQRHRRFAVWGGAEQFVEPLVSGPRLRKTPPGADHQVQRRQGAAQQYGTRDHQTRCDLPVDGQIGAETKDQRLDGQPVSLRQRGDQAALGTGLALQLEQQGLLVLPAGPHPGQHAHGLDHFRVAQIALGELVGLHGVPVGFLQVFAGSRFVPDSKARQHERRNQADCPENRMEQEHHPQINRKPGGVKKREEARPG